MAGMRGIDRGAMESLTAWTTERGGRLYVVSGRALVAYFPRRMVVPNTLLELLALYAEQMAAHLLEGVVLEPEPRRPARPKVMADPDLFTPSPDWEL